MATTEIVTGLEERPGWRHAVFHWSLVEGWLEVATGRSAFVRFGPDSFERAQALIAQLPADRCSIMDRTAADAQHASRAPV